ncbi:MAG: thioredoxin [Gemmatimonadales bacterium]|nr:MAG: thioredoxin [Gemmatimonadales bacterium]
MPGGELEGVLRDSDVPVVVDFFATWCGPCAWIVPTLRSLAETHGSRVRILKIDVDEAPDLALNYRIASVPTVILFHRGTEAGRSVGVEPERVQKMVNAAVEGAPGS